MWASAMVRRPAENSRTSARTDDRSPTEVVALDAGSYHTIGVTASGRALATSVRTNVGWHVAKRELEMPRSVFPACTCPTFQPL